ncbi:MAG: EAL domain-containing protein [Sterolibacteriaceae bacterium MAG5]|nr:EAL domain-containing protein [Candidatus Nitricoxidireducens bremensis]
MARGRGENNGRESGAASQVQHLRQALALFAEWSDCLQRSRDPDALISCLCRILSTTGGYAHVDVTLRDAGQPEGQSWLFVPDAVSLPLHHQDRRLGFLTVAPPHGRSFLPDEIDILANLADDLAFGIDSLTAERERAAIQARLDTLSRAIDQSPFAVVITDPDGRIEYCNQSLLDMTGFAASEVIGQLPSIWKSDETPAEVYRELWQAVSGGQRWQGEMRNKRRNGQLYWERQTISPIRDADGRIVRLISVKEDTTLLQEMAQALSLREQALASSNNGIMITLSKADDHSIVYVNPAFERITGYSAKEVIGLEGRFLVRDDLAQPGLNEIRNALREQRPGHAVLRNYRKDGSLFWNELFISPISDLSRHETTHFVSIINDVSERIHYQQAIEHQATHDNLTGLANRTLLHDRISQAIAFARRSSRSVAVMLLDLDHFKHVNDAFGHSAGDDLLKEVAQRLRACVRESDTVARLGGDEFVIVLSDLVSAEDVDHISEKISESLSRPVMIGEREAFVGASIGISLFPRDGEHGETLLRNADMAMYRVKEHGRNSVRLFSPEMATMAIERVDMEGALRRAIERKELLLHYQPKIDLGTRRIVGAEALVRWQHPQIGLVHPTEFIPLAEETGLVVPLGAWVMEEAFRQQAAWTAAGLPPIRMAINLSARQFRLEDLPDIVNEKLAATGAKPGSFIFELTESMVMQDAERALTVMHSLKTLGISLSLDDFGTGYSSLSYLRRFPIDEVKIDRSFVRDLHHDPDDAAIAAAVVALARTLGLKVVAEGVEMEEQVNVLERLNCDQVQGYFFGRPLDPADFEARLRREGGQ